MIVFCQIEIFCVFNDGVDGLSGDLFKGCFHVLCNQLLFPGVTIDRRFVLKTVGFVGGRMLIPEDREEILIGDLGGVKFQLKRLGMIPNTSVVWRINL